MDIRAQRVKAGIEAKKAVFVVVGKKPFKSIKKSVLLVQNPNKFVFKINSRETFVFEAV